MASFLSLLKKKWGMADFLAVAALTMILLVGWVYYGYSRVSEETLQRARQNMVTSQIQNRGILNQPVIEAMLKVERHRFVPEDMIPYAYDDYPLPIGEEQTISQPYIVALMSELLDPQKSDDVLEIGTGSGYQAAILAEIVRDVYSIEIVESLGKKSQELLQTLGYENIHVKIGDGYQGWPEKAPFDKIIVTAAPDHIPQTLVDQLKIGGKMVIPVGITHQELLLITKDEKGIHQENILPVRFVPMTGGKEK